MINLLLKTLLTQSATIKNVSKLIAKVKKYKSFSMGEAMIGEIFKSMRIERDASLKALRNMIEAGASKEELLKAVDAVDKATDPLEIVERLPEEIPEFDTLKKLERFIALNYESLLQEFRDMVDELRQLGYEDDEIYAKVLNHFIAIYNIYF